MLCVLLLVGTGNVSLAVMVLGVGFGEGLVLGMCDYSRVPPLFVL
jgi:hypothetical protein